MGEEKKALRTAISVVITAYNEQECIAECVREARDALRALERPFEIIVVDDGSADETFSALRSLKRVVPELRILRFRRNCGQTAAMDAGFRKARGDAVAALDADGQNDPSDLPAMLERLRDCDVVCGVRVNRADGYVRRLSSRVANAARNVLTGERITDTGCTLKVFRRAFLERVKLYDGMHRFLPTLLRMEGARVLETPVAHRPRLKGKSKYGVGNRLFRGLRDLMAVRWMKSRRLNYRIRDELP